MTVFRHELKQGFRAFLIWTASISFLLIICIFMFPEMKGEMDTMNDMFSSMGSFTKAFGMEKINFGSLIGFYAVECGNILGLGGAFFAALIAISSLAKEEKEHTAEFLLTHPISRTRVIAEKLCSVMVQIILMNLIIWLLSAASIALIGESVPWKELNLLHLAYLILQVEIAAIAFGFSAFLRRGSIGIGLGFAALLYFLGIIRNISDSAGFLKYVTPFCYSDGAEIVTAQKLDGSLILIGAAYSVLAVAAAFFYYRKKDIH